LSEALTGTKTEVSRFVTYDSSWRTSNRREICIIIAAIDLWGDFPKTLKLDFLAMSCTAAAAAWLAMLGEQKKATVSA
jgi:hypothetical protein